MSLTGAESMLNEALREAELLASVLNSDGLVTPPPTPGLLSSSPQPLLSQMTNGETCGKGEDMDLSETSLEHLFDVCSVDFDLTSCNDNVVVNDVSSNYFGSISGNSSGDDVEDHAANATEALISPFVDLMWNSSAVHADQGTPSASGSDDSSISELPASASEVFSPAESVLSEREEDSVGNSSSEVDSVAQCASSPVESSISTSSNKSLSQSSSLVAVAQRQAASDARKNSTNTTTRNCGGISCNTLVISCRQSDSKCSFDSSSVKDAVACKLMPVSTNQRGVIVGSINRKLVSSTSVDRKKNYSAKPKATTLLSANQKAVLYSSANQTPLQLYSRNQGTSTFLSTKKNCANQLPSSKKEIILVQRQSSDSHSKPMLSRSPRTAQLVNISGAILTNVQSLKTGARSKLAHFVICSTAAVPTSSSTTLTAAGLSSRRQPQARRRPSVLTLARSSSSLPSSLSCSTAPATTKIVVPHTRSPASSPLVTPFSRQPAPVSLADAKRSAPPTSISGPPSKLVCKLSPLQPASVVCRSTQTSDDLEQMLLESGDSGSTLARLLLTGQDSVNGYRLCPDGQCITPSNGCTQPMSRSGDVTATEPFQELLGQMEDRTAELVRGCIDPADLGCWPDLMCPMYSPLETMPASPKA